MRSAPSLQNRIFFCISTPHTPVRRLSRMLRQASNSSKADMRSGFGCCAGHRQEFAEASAAWSMKSQQVFDRLRDALFGRIWHGSAIGRKSGSVLFSFLSSSGGGLPGRPKLERVLGRPSFFWGFSVQRPATYLSLSPICAEF